MSSKRNQPSGKAERFLRLVDACLLLVEIADDQSIAEEAAHAIGQLVPGVVADVYLGADVFQHTSGSQGSQIAIVPVESHGYSYGRFELYGTTLEQDDFVVLRLLSGLVVDAIKLRGLEASEQKRSALTYKVTQLGNAVDQGARVLRESFNDQDARSRLLARELQENVSQNLAAVILGLQKIELGDEGSVELATRLRGIAVETVKLIRELVADLASPVLDEFGLVAALLSFAEVQAPLVNFDAPEELPEIPPHTSAVCYQVIKEIARAGDFSRPVTPVSIKLKAVVGRLVIEVAVGSSVALELKRWELLRNRVESIKGSLTAAPLVDNGSLFKLEVPLL